MRLILLALTCACIVSGCHKIETVSGQDLNHYAYVWNRVYSESLNDNISLYGSHLDGLSVLAVELSWFKGKLSVAMADLPKNSKSVSSISIRINDFSGSVKSKQKTILEETEKALKRYTESGFNIEEIQLDYDCPESKLSQYTELLKTVKKNYKQKVSITALPSWLNSKAFSELAVECDNYILQLHSLRRPQNIYSIPELFDRKKALKWIYDAARVGEPFAISLPTYGYYLGFNGRGDYLGVSSEQGPKDWPWTQALLSNPDEIQKFIFEIQDKRPALLTSVYWFRLDHKKDKLNWDFLAVKKLISGEEIDIEKPEVLFEKSGPGLVDIFIENKSLFPVSIPTEIKLNTKNKKPLIYEAFQDFSLLEDKEGFNVISRKVMVLAPGEKVLLCWMKFESEIEGEVTHVH